MRITAQSITALILLCLSIPAFALDAPVLITSTSGLSLSLSWTAIPGATGYTLHYAPSPYTGSDSIVQASMGTHTFASYTLLNGASYYVAIKANNSSELSGYSNIEMFTIVNYFPPEDTCDRDHLYLCKSNSTCSSTGGYWWRIDNSCNSTLEPFICTNSTLDLCASRSTCTSAGGYYYDDRFFCVTYSDLLLLQQVKMQMSHFKDQPASHILYLLNNFPLPTP